MPAVPHEASRNGMLIMYRILFIVFCFMGLSEIEKHSGEYVQRPYPVFTGKFLQPVEQGIGVSLLIQEIACRDAYFNAIAETVCHRSIEKYGVFVLFGREHGIIMLC